MLDDRDAELTLWCLDELQYRGLAHVDERWEWSPAVLTLRAVLESAFEAELRRGVGDLPRTFAEVSRERGLVAAFDAVDRALPGPGASRYEQRSVSLPQWQELGAGVGDRVVEASRADVARGPRPLGAGTRR